MGSSHVFWGRLGKGLQFLVALGVIVELVGPERLGKVSKYCVDSDKAFQRKASDWNPLEGRPSSELSRAQQACIIVGYLSEACAFAWLFYSIYRALEQRWDIPTALYFVLPVGAFLAIRLIAGRVYYEYLKAPLYFLVYNIGRGIGWVLWWAIAGIIYWCCLVPIVRLSSWLLRKLAALLGNKSLNNWVKGMGLLVLAVGFHFDLLAS